MSKEYSECVYNLWTGFVGKATCEAGYLNCDGLSCSMYTPKKDAKPQTNADRVRQMTDEGIEDWYWWMHKKMMHYTDSRIFVHDWLKAPAEKEVGK